MGVGVAGQHLVADEVLDERQGPARRGVVGIRHAAVAVGRDHHVVLADHGLADHPDQDRRGCSSMSAGYALGSGALPTSSASRSVTSPRMDAADTGRAGHADRSHLPRSSRWQRQRRRGLYAALCVDSPPETWTYMSGGPFDDRNSFAGLRGRPARARGVRPARDPAADGTRWDRRRRPARDRDLPARSTTANGSAEVGTSPTAALQRTTAATEAMYLMGARLRRPRLPALRVEVRLPQRALPARGRTARLHLRGQLPAAPWSTRAATGTPPGSPSPTASGRAAARRTSAGWTRRTSTTRGSNAGHWVLQRCKDGGIVLA